MNGLGRAVRRLGLLLVDWTDEPMPPGEPLPPYTEADLLSEAERDDLEAEELRKAGRLHSIAPN